jgi:hypothetical protein
MCIVILVSCPLCPFINYSEVLTVCQVYVKNIFHYYNNSNIFYRNFGKCILSCIGIKFKRIFFYVHVSLKYRLLTVCILWWLWYWFCFRLSYSVLYVVTTTNISASSFSSISFVSKEIIFPWMFLYINLVLSTI